MFEVKKEILETHEALLTVEIDEEVTVKELRKTARDLSRRIRVPGFRKGKVPYNVMVRRVGEEALRQELAENLINEIYTEVIEEADIEPYAAGSLEDLEIKPLTYIIRVPLVPKVDLGNYRDMRLTFEDVTVTEEELEDALEQVREDHAQLDPVDRPVELGDQVQLDIYCETQGTPLVNQKDYTLVLDTERPFITPGFVEALVGMDKDEEKTFVLTLPEDFGEEDFAGQDMVCTVKVLDVASRTLPGLDDALASLVGSYETFEDLKTDLYERMVAYKETQEETRRRNELLEALLEHVEVLYPPALLDDEIDKMVDELKEYFQETQQLKLEDALRLQGQTMEQFRESVRPQALERLRQNLALSEFISLEELNVTSEALQQRAKELLKSDEDFDLTSIEWQRVGASALNEILFERLEQIASGELEAQGDVEAEDVEEAVAENEAEVEAVAPDETETETVEAEEVVTEPEAEGPDDVVEDEADETAE